MTEYYDTFDGPQKSEEEIGKQILDDTQDWSIHYARMLKNQRTLFYNRLSQIIKDELIDFILADLRYNPDTNLASQALLQLLSLGKLDKKNYLKCYATIINIVHTCPDNWSKVVSHIIPYIQDKIINIDGDEFTVLQDLNNQVDQYLDLYQPQSYKQAGLSLLHLCPNLVKKARTYIYETQSEIKCIIIDHMETFDLWHDNQFLQYTIYHEDQKVKEKILSQLFKNHHKLEQDYINKLRLICVELLNSRYELQSLIFSNFDIIWDPCLAPFVKEHQVLYFEDLCKNKNQQILQILWNPNIPMPPDILIALKDTHQVIKYIEKNFNNQFQQEYLELLIQWKPSTDMLLLDIGQKNLENVNLYYKNEKYLLQKSIVPIYIQNIFKILNEGNIIQQTQCCFNLLELLRFSSKQDILILLQKLKKGNFKARMIYIYMNKLISENFSKLFYQNSRLSILDMEKDKCLEVRLKLAQALPSIYDVSNQKPLIVQILNNIIKSDKQIVKEAAEQSLQIINNQCSTDTQEQEKQESETDIFNFDDIKTQFSFKDIKFIKPNRKVLPTLSKTPRRPSIQLTKKRMSTIKLPKL
ncbi:hypothetical protein pb186bvf_000597 [Paramecium bursaria]